MNIPIVSFLEKFVTIPDDEKSIISSAFSVKIFKPRTTIHPAGKGLEHLYLVEKGLLKLVVERTQSETSVFSFVEGCQVVGISSLYSTSGYNPLSLMTVTETTVWSIKLCQFEELSNKYKYLGHAMLAATRLSIAEAISIKSAYLGLTAYQKYSKLMKMQPYVVLNAPLKDIASYLEITPQSISRIRRNARPVTR
ncbi:Crp/Fnr family transcriptional regulator [Mucilaginibacter endophyticus]|uniref:Crp/Fnr family transcriptional regulator n=1 Tax=Mucilaginibacter endophyticus TaxID=2675003 RepID=UPI000E0CE64E|nr:Crp/Fnr family transcriptional regulator [Mucilaginibacter endophyticus]